MGDIAVIVPARLKSTRVPNKMLRPFGGTTLFDLCLSKLEGLKCPVFAAVHEPELAEVAKAHGTPVLLRTASSVTATKDLDVHGQYLGEVTQRIVMLVMACQPLLAADTVRKAIDRAAALLKMHGEFKGLTAVYQERRWVWNTRGDVVNTDPEVNDSQLMDPIYVSANCLYTFDRDYYLRTKQYWSFLHGSPEMFVVDKKEALDVDTLHDFEVAEALWKQQYYRGNGYIGDW